MTDRKGGFDSALSFFYRSAVSAEGVCDIIFGITFKKRIDKNRKKAYKGYIEENPF